MKIKIHEIAEETFCPEIDENLSLPEKDRFGFVLKKPSRFLLLDALYSKEKTARLEYVKMFVARVLNPITIVEGKKERDFVIDDLILPFTELEQIATQLWLKCVELSKQDIDEKK